MHEKCLVIAVELFEHQMQKQVHCQFCTGFGTAGAVFKDADGGCRTVLVASRRAEYWR
jgi:hypothetical protein